MKNHLLIILLTVVSLSSSGAFAMEKDPFGSFCKDTNQTFTQCKTQAEEAYKACEKSVEESEQDSLNMVSDQYSMKYCQNTLKSLLQWCQTNCKP